jgi:heme oxygenase (biliverdin-IX-beta and delta-forming)
VIKGRPISLSLWINAASGSLFRVYENCYLEAMSRHQRGHVHQTLRRATAAAHHALDHHRLLQRLTDSELTREQYAESLAAMYRPHAWLERRVHESRHHFKSGLQLSPRLALLEADLLELGCTIPLISQTSPDLADERASWWGRVYVLEGSRQGSAVIARCIQSSLYDTVPYRFFSGAKLSDDYSNLLAILERELEDHESLQQAVASAQAAFAAYKAGLDAFDARQGDIEAR